MTGVTAPFPDPTDRATLETDRNFTLRIRDRERKLISKIREALDRIDAGTYGYCDLCGGEISRKAPQSPAGDHHVHRLQIQGRRPWSGPGANKRLSGANPSWSSAGRVRGAALNRNERQHHLPAAPCPSMTHPIDLKEFTLPELEQVMAAWGQPSLPGPAAGQVALQRRRTALRP